MKLSILVWLTTIGLFLLLAAIFSVLLFFVGVDNFIFYATAFSLIMIGIQWYIGPYIVMLASGARVVTEKEDPLLHSMIAELAADAGIPKPRVCTVENDSPNAFAFGRTQKDSYVAVHTGLIKRLSKEELRAVLAHEIAHIKHADVAVITAASVLPVILYYGVIFALGRRSDDRMGIWLGALAAQFVGQLAVLWLSRQREYFADAYAKEAIGDPLPLARSLVKISYSLHRAGEEPDPSLRSLYIAGPEKIAPELLDAISYGRTKELVKRMEKEKGAELFEFFSTHPLTIKRLVALLT